MDWFYYLLLGSGIIIALILEFLIRRPKKQKNEQKKWEEDTTARHKNPPLVFLPENREFVCFSFDCHGFIIVARSLPRQAPEETFTVKFFDPDAPKEVGDYTRFLYVQQGKTPPKHCNYTPWDPEVYVLPQGEKLVSAQPGCQDAFLTRMRHEGEKIEKYELYQLDPDNDKELARCGFIQET